ncbi:MAG: DUF255 domain-containing protein [Bacteroidota bacterium]|nr:DUF255 domain-containing protein [Candidatus Kapabacteria bacterium]MDW8220920.1 DUF255 domain-containing protein [Bacteroidota bacterium]
MSTFRLSTLLCSLFICWHIDYHSTFGQLIHTPENRTYSSPSLSWHSIREGLQLAKEHNKPLVIDVYTDWCSWCKVMDEKTYNHHDIVRTLTTSYIPVKFNPEKDPSVEFQGSVLTAREFAKKLGVSGYPTTAFLKPDGSVIDVVAGYIEATRFSAILHFIASKRYETENMRLSEYMLLQDIERDPNNPRLRLYLAYYYSDSVHYRKALETFEYVATMKPSNHQDLFELYSGLASVQLFFAKDFARASQNFQQSLAYAPEPQSKARIFLLAAYAEAAQQADAQAVAYLDAFLKHCKDNKLSIEGIRQVLETAPQFASIRNSSKFQRFLQKLPR